MNKIMIVTGGSRGIGAATALLAAQRGYAVCVNYLHNRKAAEEVVRTGAMDDVDPGRTVDAIVAAGILAPRGKDIRTRGQRK